MLMAGAAWGVYSIRGKGAGAATRVTAGNFLRAVPFAVVLSLLPLAEARLDAAGVGYALASGATSAATVQLSVPVIAALGGIVFLGEALTLRFVLASAAVLGGIALVILSAPSRRD
mgnify:FL=1